VFVTSVNGVFHFVPSVATPDPQPHLAVRQRRLHADDSGEGGVRRLEPRRGADLWLKPRVGLRFECPRSHPPGQAAAACSTSAFRVGVVFR
jgi:hypothetical protein